MVPFTTQSVEIPDLTQDPRSRDRSKSLTTPIFPKKKKLKREEPNGNENKTHETGDRHTERDAEREREAKKTPKQTKKQK